MLLRRPAGSAGWPCAVSNVCARSATCQATCHATLTRDTWRVADLAGQLLGCSFHPELTEDMRWHEHFVRMVREHKGAAAEPEAEPEA